MLEKLTDSKLISETVRLVKAEKRATVEVLTYVAEIEKRGVWIGEGYASLQDFCERKLNYSRDEARRRIHAARCIAQFDQMKELLLSNSMCLTSVGILSAYLTDLNAGQILEDIKGMSTREIEDYLDQKFPESREKKLFMQIDEELEKLLEEAQKEVNEKERLRIMKSVLKAFLSRKTRNSKPKKHTRYVPKAVQRTANAAYQHQCAFTADSGVRCNQTAHLEPDHIRPWAKGGSSLDPNNIRPLCRAHNLYMARRDFPNSPHLATKSKLRGLRDLARDSRGSKEKLVGDLAQDPRATQSGDAQDLPRDPRDRGLDHIGQDLGEIYFGLRASRLRV